jgi:radical SAM superfamily enzyme YgiQ (UPF0313 family)
MNNKHLLLINPWIYDFAAYDLWIKPIGLLYMAALLRKHGYTLSFIDCIDRWNPDLLKRQHREVPHGREDGRGKFYREEIEKPAILKQVSRKYCRYGLPEDIFLHELDKVPDPFAIMVTSGMTYWYPGVQRAIALARKQFPEAPVILGGIYATLEEEHARKYSGADYVITGPGENSLIALIKRLEGAKEYSYDNYATLDQLPYPAYDLIRVHQFLPILTSRGCPYRCSFCASFRLFNSFYQRDPFKVVEELEYYIGTYQVKNIAFYDDALLLNSQNHIELILKEVLRRGLKVSFHTPNGLHPKQMTPSLAELMKKADFKTIKLSLESSDEQRQKQMERKVANSDFSRALEYLEAAGYERKTIEVYLLMGLPGQPLNEVIDSISFVGSSGAKIRLASFSPIRGTAEWEKAVKEYGLDAQIDPLLLNKTCYPLQREGMDTSVFSRLRDYANDINRALEKGNYYLEKEALLHSLKSDLKLMQQTSAKVS